MVGVGREDTEVVEDELPAALQDHGWLDPPLALADGMDERIELALFVAGLGRPPSDAGGHQDGGNGDR